MAHIEPIQIELRDGRTLTIRAAVASDGEASYALRRMDYPGKVTLPHEYTDSLEVYSKSIDQALADPARLWLVAEADNALAGQITVQPENDKRQRLSHVCWFGMALLPHWRGLGLGHALLSRAISWAEEHPRFEKLALGVLSNNPGAMALYRKLGFIEEGRKVREVKLASGDYLDDILMYRWVG